VKIKQLDNVTYDQISQAFKRDDLIIFTDSKDFRAYLFNLNLANSALLLMSSGNYGGLDFNDIKNLIV